MIKAEDAIRVARSLIGTPYSQLDCINLIKKVIRDAPGGVPAYTTAGTNTLWKSYDSSPKYKDLTWRQESIKGARAGMLAFKRSGSDVHHVGFVTENGTVIHSSSAHGGIGVIETELDGTWDLLAIHRYIEPEADEREGSAGMESYKAQVSLSDPESTLNVRNAPSSDALRIGKLSHGAKVTVYAELYDAWLYIDYGEGVNGYVAKKYVKRIEDEPKAEENTIVVSPEIAIIDDAGNTFRPKGSWRVVIGGND